MKEEAPTPIQPRVVILSAQSNEMPHIEQAPVIKKMKTMKAEAAPTSLSTCSRIRLLPGGRVKEKLKVNSHIGRAIRQGSGSQGMVINEAENIMPR